MDLFLESVKKRVQQLLVLRQRAAKSVKVSLRDDLIARPRFDGP